MSEVQRLPPAIIKFIRLHDIALHLHAGFDDLLRMLRRAFARKRVQQPGVGDHAVLDHLRHAIGKRRSRQCGQKIGIADHPVGLIKRAEQILALRQIDRRFSADGRIHAREQRGGNLDQMHAAHVGRRREAG